MQLGIVYYFELAPLFSSINNKYLIVYAQPSCSEQLSRKNSKFTNKQVFISLDDFLGNGNEVIDKISFRSTRLYLSEKAMLFGKDWRKEPSVVR